MSCSAAQKLFSEHNSVCKNRTHIESQVLTYITSDKYEEKLPRSAVVRFSVPESFSARREDGEDFGTLAARALLEDLQETAEIPLVEFMPETDWQGMRQDFYRGNYQALELGKRAGYDVLIVGDIKPLAEPDTLLLRIKALAVDEQLTLFSGSVTVHSEPGIFRKGAEQLGLTAEPMERYDWSSQLDNAVRCIVPALVAE